MAVCSGHAARYIAESDGAAFTNYNAIVIVSGDGLLFEVSRSNADYVLHPILCLSGN